MTAGESDKDFRLTLQKDVTLARKRLEGVTLEGALAHRDEQPGKQWGELLDEAVVLGWSPRSVFVGLHSRDADTVMRILDEHGKRISTEDWFEARVFNADAELRWMQRPAGGIAVLVSENQNLADDELNPGGSVTRIDGVTALVWGRVASTDNTGAPNGGESKWAVSSAARIGSRAYPVTGAKPGDSILVESCEYLISGQEGNAVVIEERLTGLAVQRSNSGKA